MHHRRPTRRNAFIALCVAVSALALTACDKALTIPARFPEPVVEQLPIDVGLRYPEAFRTYRLDEETEESGHWSIDIGAANVAMFDAVARRLFRSATPVGNGETSRFDAIIEPAVEALEFSLPGQSGTDRYSVWIRYTLKVTAPDGETIANWTVSAYGESGSSTLKPASSMERAAVLALRDAAASIVLGFGEEPTIRSRLLRQAAPEENSDALEPEKIP